MCDIYIYIYIYTHNIIYIYIYIHTYIHTYSVSHTGGRPLLLLVPEAEVRVLPRGQGGRSRIPSAISATNIICRSSSSMFINIYIYIYISRLSRFLT